MIKSALLGLFLLSPCWAFIDYDNDGLDDIWEAYFDAGALVAESDEDLDGRSNREECVAGTNPFNSNDVHRAVIERMTTGLRVSSPTEPGKLYKLSYKTELTETNWWPTGLTLIGSGSNVNVNLDDAGSLRITGGATSEIWTDTSGTTITTLLATPGYPDLPQGTELLPRLKRRVNQSDHYGGRIRGYLIPPETGNYTFYIASRHQGELHLSPNADTNNLVRIARCADGKTLDEEFTRAGIQRSAAITLNQHEKYYFEVRHKHAAQEDHVTVAWTGPGIDTNTPRVVEGTYLSPWIPASQIPLPDMRFLRLSVEDLDSDGDGLSDWAEHIMFNFMPQDANSTSSGMSDFATVTEMLQSTGSVLTVTLRDDDAYEIGASAARNVARFQVNRSGGLAALTIPIDLSPSTDPAHGHPDASDYRAEDLAGKPVSNQLSLPFGATSVEVVIDPVRDALHEFPESLVLTLQDHPDYRFGTNRSNIIRINDARVVPENETLFIGLYQPESRSESVGFGIATLILNGNKSIARVNNSFSALTSRQTNTHIHKALLAPDMVTLTAGMPVEEIVSSDGRSPLLGQLVEYEWAIHPSGAWNAQDMIDSLYQQNGATPLYINVHTENYPSGEVWAFFSLQEGSTELQVPPDPPALPALSSPELTYDVHRFLTQATFGPTSNEVTALVNEIETTHSGDRLAGYEAWIDTQFAMEQTLLLDYALAADMEEWELRQLFDWPTNTWTATGTPPPAPTRPATWPSYTGDVTSFDSRNPSTWRTPTGPYPLEGVHISNEDAFTPRLGEPNHHNRRRGMWTIMARARDQLRQRMAFAWSQIMVVSAENTTVQNNHYGTARYYDQLGENADDSYRQMLEDVTYSPIMGRYLSSLFNQKAILDATTGDVLVSPDENYAREIMQLFSIGLLKRHLDGSIQLDDNGLPMATYDNDDITELSRIFTGFSFSLYANNNEQWDAPLQNTLFNRGDGNKYYSVRYEYPMSLFGEYHDPDPKIILDDQLIDNTGIADLDVRANADVADALDALATHPTAPAFISRLLIQRLVTSNPSRGYLYRVAKTFDDTDGNLQAVTKAILLDYEARELSFTQSDSFGKPKEPLIRYLSFVRAMEAKSQLPVSALTSHSLPASQLDNFEANAMRYRYGDTTTGLGQTPLRAPSVFNWFLPDYQPGGEIAQAGLSAPELQIANENSMIRGVNSFWGQIANLNGTGVTGLIGADALADNIIIDRTPWVNRYSTFTGTEAEKDEQLVDAFDDLLTAGNLKRKYANAVEPNPRSIIVDMLTTITSTQAETKIINALYLITNSPEYLVQK